MGIPFNDDYNAATQEGVAYPQYMIANGKRFDWLPSFTASCTGSSHLGDLSSHARVHHRATACSAFLPPEVQKRPNLTICTYAHVTNIVFDDKNRAIGALQSLSLSL
jgi:choline dehydrogenase-like flavoprotein